MVQQVSYGDLRFAENAIILERGSAACNSVAGLSDIVVAKVLDVLIFWNFSRTFDPVSKETERYLVDSYSSGL